MLTFIQKIELRDFISRIISTFGYEEVERVSGYDFVEINRFLGGAGLNERTAQDFFDTLGRLGSQICRG